LQRNPVRELSKATGTMKRLHLSALCATIAIALGGAIYAQSTTPNVEDAQSIIDTHESFFFASDNVVETFEHDGQCYIVYDDMDAEFDHEVVRVDRETWESIEATQSSKTGRMVGWLYLNGEYENATYSYIHDSDF
jgi:hypothetical protein